MDAVRARLGRFFGKRGGAVVDANLSVIAEAYDGVIDVTAAIGAGPDARPTEPSVEPEGSRVPMEATR